MANEQNRNPENAPESDISKAQSQQQPPSQASQQPAETGQQKEPELSGDQAATSQAQPGGSPDEGSQGETATKQRTDVEGSSFGSEERGEAESGFVGSEGKQDTSSELVEDEESKKDEGAPEDE